MLTKQSGQPSPDEFLDFFDICRPCPLQHATLKQHRVYKWLHAQQGYENAEVRFRQSEYFKVGPDFDSNTKLLWFAMLVALCFWHYFLEKQSVLWGDKSANRKRQAAARTYTEARSRLREGFGPHSDDDRQKLNNLLAEARTAVLGRDVPKAYRMKGGSGRPAGVLVRELASCFHTSFGDCFSTIIMDLVSIVEPRGVNEKTVQRHIKGLLPHLATPTDQ